ncbi:MAG: glycosyltransferase, partial [Bacteroidetes bacterium]|nr:glycosyltransferase [Bacteroidota bacterium]
NIVMFSLFRFDADIESTAMAVGKELAKTNNVLYFDNPFTLNDVLKKAKSESLKKRRGYFGIFSDRSFHLPGTRLEVFIPPVVLPSNFLPEGTLYQFILKINEFLIRQKINYVLRKRNIDSFVYINSFNFHYPGLADGLAPQLRVYHCLDPIMGSFDGRHGLPSEKQLVQTADLVICSSKKLHDDKIVRNSHTYFVPNAADVQHSQKALDPELAISSLLKNIPQPIVGYLGSIDHRMNFQLLQKTAIEHPDKSFVLVGPVQCAIPEHVQQCPNIYFPGKTSYAEMPAVLKGFAVCIIPFHKDELSATVFPLKLFEYLGAAKPVVISDFNPDLADFTDDLVQICSTYADFSKAIQLSLDTDSPALRARRIELAAQNTWVRRGEDIAALLSEALIRKSGRPL